ncbi:hypothetical protein BZA70DRAFT_107697 [Myxozyma melibiosi]|uniref:Histone transcription regulator 3 homolog n=1 Tax=Myxozyma melibiosi TaxID=54550 RepID=A0ABR1F9S3_9ASCO
MAEFAEALIHESDDTDFWLKIAAYMPALNCKRLSRYALECVVSENSRPDTFEDALSTESLSTLDDLAGVNALRNLLTDLGDIKALEHPLYKTLEKLKFDDAVQKYIEASTSTPNWLKPLIEDIPLISETLANNRPEPVTIKLSNETWTSVGKSLLQYSSKASLSIQPLELAIVSLELQPDETQDAEVKMQPAPVEKSEQTEPEAEEKPEKDNEANDQIEAARKKKRKSFADHQIEGERSSRRVRARAEEQSNAETTNDHEFFNEMDQLFEPLGIKFGDLIAASSIESDDVAGPDLPLKDFMSNLKHPKDNLSKTLLHGDGIQNPSAAASRLLDLAISKPVASSTDHLDETKGVEEFVSSVNDLKNSYQEASIAFINHFMLPQDDGTELFLEYQWPSSLTKVIKRTATFYYDLMMNLISESVKAPTKSSVRYARLAQSYFELLLDDFIDCSQQQAGSASGKAHIAEYQERLTCWRLFTMDLLSSLGSEIDDNLRLRFEWATIIFEQAIGTSHEDISIFFEDFREKIELLSADISILLPNSAFIPDISAAAIDLQKSKLQAASLFSGIFEASTDDPEERIKLLEVILERGDRDQLSDIGFDLKVIENFVENSSTEFKLYLWTLLRQSYELASDWKKSFDCVLIKLRLVIRDLTSADYEKLDYSHRSFVMFKSLFLIRELLAKAADSVMSDDKYIESLTNDAVIETSQSLVQLLRILHVYILYEDGVVAAGGSISDNSTYNKCASRLRTMIVQAWCLLYLCYRRRITETEVDVYARDTKLLVFLFALHEELGTREFCMVSHGIFLQLLQNEIMRIDRPSETEYELLQCIHCRFGLTISGEYFFPYDHKATPISFDKTNALQLVGVVMSLAMRRKNTQSNMPKADLKSVLDKCCEVIGVPRRDQTSIYYNQSVIDTYLAKSIHPLLLQRSLKGLETISTIPVQGDYSKVAMIGLYFLQGQIYLTQYKSRKRTMAGRTEDLDYAIRYFKHDLVCDTNRFESWYGLAQTYDAQAEDDLTWSAEKLNGDQKTAIAATQRKALLCYFLALSLLLRNEAIVPPDSVLSTFWTDFGYELYASTRPPNEMAAYQVAEYERHFSGSLGMYTKPAHSEVKSTAALKLSLNMFQQAIKQEPTEWRNYYMQGKCLGKLDAEPKQVLDCYVKALEFVPEKAPSGDPIFEPQYRLLALISKYFYREQIDISTALEYVKKSQYYKEPEEPITERAQLFTLLIDCLTRLRTADKKHWHHRPTYRIAVIADKGLNDVTRAKEEMASLYSLKAAKSFMNIWRPEFERAGRHFYYAYKYTKYYIDLLGRDSDLESLNLITRKLRKLSNVIINPSEVWEFACKNIVEVLRKLSDIPDRYLENNLVAISVDEFLSKSARLETCCKSIQPLPKLLYYLYEAYELRKMNVGFASTAGLGLDDAFSSIYLKLYFSVPELERELLDKAGGPTTPPPVDVDMSGDDGSSPMGHYVTASNTPTGSDHNPTSVDSKAVSSALGTLTTTMASDAAAPPGTPAPTTGPVTTTTGRSRTARVTKKEVISRANALIKPYVSVLEAAAAANTASKESAAGKEPSSKETKEAADSSAGNSSNEAATTTTTEKAEVSEEVNGAEADAVDAAPEALASEANGAETAAVEASGAAVDADAAEGKMEE